MAKVDPHVLAHLEWIGFVQPTGLVVSAPALVRAGAILNTRDAEGQGLLRSSVDTTDDADPRIRDFRAFARTVLGWSFSPKGYAGTPEAPIPPELEVPLPDSGETLRPDYAVREPEPQNGAPAWQLLVRVLEPEQDFDLEARAGRRSELSPQSRMERLLRQTGVPAGLLVGSRALRLVSAPRGESSGWIDFRLADMLQTAGRPICAALRVLLSEQRLLALPRPQRLAALLADSRRFQNEVSEKLAEQILHALYELLRGFQAAHDATRGELLRRVLREDPNEVYRALLTVILRLVFLLYAEEREMLPQGETFLRYYSVAGLHERLREEAALYPDTMDQRYGAWAQLIALFRMIHDGASAEGLHLPPRHGVLFDPDRFPFLEGRTLGGVRQVHERIDPPLVPDGTVYRALEKLLVLDGERISYRALDVEQIGSVYETMMGFRLETATGRSVAIRAHKKHGAPSTVDLEALLAEPGSGRARWLQDRADRKVSDNVKKAVAAAASLEDLHAALLPVIDEAATPDLVAQGAMVLQPSEERRRSGSHYTPRELTEPIVRTTLEPILARLRGSDGRPPHPQAILDLKVCDPAMGSGAFLVEACRYLAEALLEAWQAHGGRPEIPADEDERVFARRLIAQRCLYGVDRNPVAVDLAKMSLWLATLAKDHPLTFVDHALRHGDSLVGLSRRQLEAFHWAPDAPRFQKGFEKAKVHEHLAKVTELRLQIREAGEGVSEQTLRRLWEDAQFELEQVRLLGDLTVAAFFEADRPKEREAKRLGFARAVAAGEADRWRGWLEERRHADPPLAPFHWEIEFPEVFERDNPGFDAFVGNPPFAGVTALSERNQAGYTDWLRATWPGTGGKCDLVAFFFRRSFDLIRAGARFGLLATNTIASGDTRESGLSRICDSGGNIYSARKRIKWPGAAAVIVSAVHVEKGRSIGDARLDGRPVPRVSAFLLAGEVDHTPPPLKPAIPGVTKGVVPYGEGFVVGDEPDNIPPVLIEEVFNAEPQARVFVKPYLRGWVLNSSVTLEPDARIVDLSGCELSDLVHVPRLIALLRKYVKPGRDALSEQSGANQLKERWWRFQYEAKELFETIRTLKPSRVIAVARVGPRLAFAFVRPDTVFNEKVIVFPERRACAFAILQSCLHDAWARFLTGVRKDDLNYSPTHCFNTFPFPDNWGSHPALETAGEAYHDFRAALMVRNNEGLTKTYNRFHDPDERDPSILKLRELHAGMDRAVLDAYGWSDIDATYDFLLDYEIDEEESGDRKKPWRYRWPDEVQAEVLARLLELNAERASAEARSGVAAGRAARRKSANRDHAGPEPGGLFA